MYQNPTKKSKPRCIDMRPKVTQELHDEIKRRGEKLGIAKNTYLAMLIQAACNIPDSVLFATIQEQESNGSA